MCVVNIKETSHVLMEELIIKVLTDFLLTKLSTTTDHALNTPRSGMLRRSCLGTP